MEFLDPVSGKWIDSRRIPEEVRERIADTVEWENEDQRHKITGDVDIFHDWVNNNFDRHDLSEMLIPDDDLQITPPEEPFKIDPDNPGYKYHQKLLRLYPDAEIRAQVVNDALERAMDGSKHLPPDELYDPDDDGDDYHQW